MLDEKQSRRHAVHREILTTALETHYVTLLDDSTNDPNLDVSHEVMDILAMFTRLRLSFEHLAGASAVSAQDIEFSGFHPQFESEMLGFARFYMKKLGRHRWLSETLGEGLESAAPMLDVYRRMLAVWKSIGMSKVLTDAEIVQIVAARAGLAGAPPMSEGETKNKAPVQH
jgi:uncharacterized protein YfbU (UPF0304 family)